MISHEPVDSDSVINLRHFPDSTTTREEEGLPTDTPCCISVSTVTITGEPVDKLFVWAHSMCTLNNIHLNEVLVFGGFVGVGGHARRNDTLIPDTET
ncbi:hypothetical protein MKW92_052952, partial [Papaver armeniacum]